MSYFTRNHKVLTAAIALTASLAFLGGAAACGSSSDSSSAKPKVDFLISTMDNPFFVEMKAGAEKEAKAKGIDLFIADGKNDPTTQQHQAEQAQTRGAKVVIMNTVDSDAAAAPTKKLLNQKIPVVVVDRGVTGVTTDSFIASNNVEGGRKAADALAKSIDEKGEALVLLGQSGSDTTTDRTKGFEEQIKKYPNIKVVSSQAADFDLSKAVKVTTNMMQAHPTATAIYAENDEMALGAIKALGDKAGKDVKVIGYDGTPDGLAAVKAGTEYADVAQQPRKLGAKAVDAAYDIIKGKKVQKQELIPVVTVTKDNLSEFETSSK